MVGYCEDVSTAMEHPATLPSSRAMHSTAAVVDIPAFPSTQAASPCAGSMAPVGRVFGGAEAVALQSVAARMNSAAPIQVSWPSMRTHPHITMPVSSQCLSSTVRRGARGGLSAFVAHPAWKLHCDGTEFCSELVVPSSGNWGICAAMGSKCQESISPYSCSV